MVDNYASYADTPTRPGMRHATLAASANVLNPIPKAIRCDVAGTATFADADGTSITYNLLAGERLDWRPTKFTAGTATLIAWY